MRALVTAGLVSVAFAKECGRHLQLVLLQDASTSFWGPAQEIAQLMPGMVKELESRLEVVETAFIAFSDKPVPFRGNGRGRGYPGKMDECYNRDFADHKPLDVGDNLAAGMANLAAQTVMEGGDYPENPYEAMMYAALDPELGWKPSGLDDDNNNIVKILLVVTDDHPHYAGDAQNGINSWNPDGSEYQFYGEIFDQMNGIYSTSVNRYADLMKIVKDYNVQFDPDTHMPIPETIPENKKLEWEELIRVLGPDYFEPVAAHPGTFEASTHCWDYEYPTLDILGKSFQANDVLPIVIVSEQSGVAQTFNMCEQRGFPVDEDELNAGDQPKPTWGECLVGVYNADLTAAKVPHFQVSKYSTDPQDLISQIIDTVDSLSKDLVCPDDTTTTTSTKATTTTTKEVIPTTVPTKPTTTTTEAETTKKTTTTEAETTKKTTTTESTKPTTTTTEPTEPTTTTRTTTTKPTTTKAETTGKESSTTTEELETDTTGGFVPVPVPDNGGSKTGVIAGAAGGAAAGVAAVAGALYKKFGTGLFKKPNADMGVTEQVEVPETPVEREALEEVTMDMFQ